MTETSAAMQRALDAAARVRGTTSPNPWVGAAIEVHGEVIAVGATSPPGGPHAEAAAIAAAGASAHGSTLYSTLEPCFPFEGKRTPPCSQAIIEAGIARVVIAVEDADPRVRGRGTALLREAGIQVDVGDGASPAAALLRPYVKHRQTGLPYLVAKFAASLDGRIATSTGESKWITGEVARNRAHQERAHVDAILVGSGTVLVDDPSLTARPGGVVSPRQPIRVVLDARGRIPGTAALFRQPGHTVVATSRAADAAWKRAITGAGAQIIECETDAHGLNPHQLLQVLAQRGIISIWVEGGPTLLGSLFAESVVDEVWAFLAPLIIGGDGLPAVAPFGARSLADAFPLRDPSVELLHPDVLVRGYTGSWWPH